MVLASSQRPSINGKRIRPLDYCYREFCQCPVPVLQTFQVSLARHDVFQLAQTHLCLYEGGPVSSVCSIRFLVHFSSCRLAIEVIGVGANPAKEITVPSTEPSFLVSTKRVAMVTP